MKREFDDIYDELTRDVGIDFDKKFEITKYIKIMGIIILISIILYFILGFEVAGAILVIGGFYIFFQIIKVQDKKLDAYKNIIITKFISLYNNAFNYSYKSNITEYEYRRAKLSDKFDEFITTDLISGKLNAETDFKFARVVTHKVETEVSGDSVSTHKIETYNGFYGMIPLKRMLKVDMFVTSNDFKQKYNSKRVELDSEKFERHFDCFSDNKIMALQILTPEVIDVLNDVYENLRKTTQIRICGDTLHFRVFDENLFIPGRMKQLLDKERLKRLYIQIDSIYNILNGITENLKDVY